MKSLGCPVLPRPFSTVAFSLAALMLVGCGNGESRFDVAGTVHFRGLPVPLGRIQFVPDTTQGNRGPAGFAEIQAGKFDTRGGKGVVAGPHWVEITGFDGLASTDANSEALYGSMLFPTNRQQIELSSDRDQLHFDVGGQ